MASSLANLVVEMPRARLGRRRSSTNQSARGRRMATVLSCGCGCTRRTLIAGVLSGRGALGAEGSNQENGSFVELRKSYDANFAKTMDSGMKDYEQNMAAVKTELFSHIVGDTVLEIGLGNGPNMRYFSGLHVMGVEPNAQSFEYAAAAARANNLASFEPMEGVGEHLPMPDASVDTVVATLVMCTVADMDAVAREAKRVLRPGGVYLFLDHVAAPDGTPLRAFQSLFDPLNRAAYEGCHLTRDPLAAIERAGFASVESRRFVAGAAEGSWLTAPTMGEAFARATRGDRVTHGSEGGGRGGSRPQSSALLDAVEPHFLLSPSVVGIARV
eukprot:CAMPEP_0181365448 /NCGR_PEP_ID=MMETSP1106-20121128/10072_1 /TAXON_ID=81844 /ORGANISM="Mantoniella antarctica, Strain SL-175" /LENGTH=328 /DNA_ID=CAMNT_0023480523 /DNA_START=204 /DNA_END=1190 /DNA_ORIENTATION=-